MTYVGRKKKLSMCLWEQCMRLVILSRFSCRLFLCFCYAFVYVYIRIYTRDELTKRKEPWYFIRIEHIVQSEEINWYRLLFHIQMKNTKCTKQTKWIFIKNIKPGWSVFFLIKYKIKFVLNSTAPVAVVIHAAIGIDSVRLNKNNNKTFISKEFFCTTHNLREISERINAR